MSRPRSESGPVLNWSSPDQNSDLGRPRSEFSSRLDQFRTGLAKIRILIWAGPRSESFNYRIYSSISRTRV